MYASTLAYLKWPGYMQGSGAPQITHTVRLVTHCHRQKKNIHITHHLQIHDTHVTPNFPLYILATLIFVIEYPKPPYPIMSTGTNTTLFKPYQVSQLSTK